MPIFASVAVIIASSATNSATRSRAFVQLMSGHREAEARERAALQLRALIAPARLRADRARELADGQARLRLVDPLAVAPHLGGPDRGLEAERDRQARLPVGAPEHDGVAVLGGEPDQRVLRLLLVAARDLEHAAA